MTDWNEQAAVVPQANSNSSIAQFLGKAVIAGVVAVVCAWLISDIIMSQLDNLLDRRVASIDRKVQALIPRHIGGTGFWVMVERQLDEAADPKRDLPPEKKQKIIADLRIIAQRWRPFFLDALNAVAQDQEPKPAEK